MSHQKIFLIFLASFLVTTCSTTPTPTPKLFSRADWGAVDSIGLVKNHEISRITIHHGGEDFPATKDVVKYLKNLQSWSRNTKKWADVPYHWLIAPNGDIYQGRPDSISGDTNTTYNPSGHLLICALGNFEEIEIPEVQYASLIYLTKQKMAEYHVPIDSIRTHLDYAETQCPGKNLYKFFTDGSFKKRLK